MTTLSRRDALKFAGLSGLGMFGGMFGPGVFNGDAQAAQARPGGPLGVALCIGLNRVNPANYRGWNGALSGCINDANAMAGIAKTSGFRVRKLLDAQATKANVRGSLLRAAAGLLPGDILLVTYSGHGGQYRDLNGDETDDHLDETWCLYDGQVLDDELAILWSKLQPGVRVLVFSDSCHSGTATRAVESDLLSQMAELSNNPPAEAEAPALAPNVESERNKLLDQTTDLTPEQMEELNKNPLKIRALPDSVARMISERDEQEGVSLGDGANEKASLRETQATVLLLSGCQDNQTSRDGDRNGLFTGTFLRVWQNGGGNISDYRDLHSRILRQMPMYQSPNYFVIGGQNPTFELQKPFTI